MFVDYVGHQSHEFTFPQINYKDVYWQIMWHKPICLDTKWCPNEPVKFWLSSNIDPPVILDTHGQWPVFCSTPNLLWHWTSAYMVIFLRSRLSYLLLRLGSWSVLTIKICRDLESKPDLPTAKRTLALPTEPPWRLSISWINIALIGQYFKVLFW